MACRTSVRSLHEPRQRGCELPRRIPDELRFWFQFNSGDYETFFFDLLNLSAANIGLAIFDVGECGDLEAQVGCLVSEQCAGEISQFTVLQPNTNYLFYVFTTDPEDCGQYQFVTNGVYLACMDPVAPNYDPR